MDKNQIQKILIAELDAYLIAQQERLHLSIKEVLQAKMTEIGIGSTYEPKWDININLNVSGSLLLKSRRIQK